MSTTTTSSRSGGPGSDILCAPPTDPTGFIYPSYRAAPTQAYRDKRSLETSHIKGLPTSPLPYEGLYEFIIIGLLTVTWLRQSPPVQILCIVVHYCHADQHQCSTL